MLAAAMRLLLKCLRLGRRRRFKLVRQAGQLWHYGRLCLRSLLYNSFTNGDVVLDSLFEPVYWLVDHVTRWFGVVSTSVARGVWGGERAAGDTESWGSRCAAPGGRERGLQHGAGSARSADPSPFPLGVCGTGDRFDKLHRGHRIHLPAAPYPADVHTCLDLLASCLRTLEPHHDCLPLLQGHHHLAWAPTTGEAEPGHQGAAQPLAAGHWGPGTADY